MEVALTIFIIAVVILLVYGPSVIAILKRHYVWGAVGLLVFAPIGWIGALLLAKPESWWARNRYGDEKRAKAIAKHGEPAAVGQPPPPAAPRRGRRLGGRLGVPDLRRGERHTGRGREPRTRGPPPGAGGELGRAGGLMFGPRALCGGPLVWLDRHRPFGGTVEVGSVRAS